MDGLGNWIPLDCYDYESTRPAVLTNGRTMNISEKLTEQLREQCAHDLRVDISDL